MFLKIEFLFLLQKHDDPIVRNRVVKYRYCSFMCHTKTYMEQYQVASIRITIPL